MTYSVIELVYDPNCVDGFVVKDWCETGLRDFWAAQDHADNLRVTYGGRYEVVVDEPDD